MNATASPSGNQNGITQGGVSEELAATAPERRGSSEGPEAWLQLRTAGWWA